MKTNVLIGIIVALLLTACKKDLNKGSVCLLDMESYDLAYGIEYDHPEYYLDPGQQSNLDEAYVEEIRASMGTPDHSIEGIKSICWWFNVNFRFSNEAGRMIGKVTANELYQKKAYYGCHSAALMISSLLREFGFPAVMIETASIVWANKYIDGTEEGNVGHVMTEVYVSDKWILVDNNGAHVEEYDCRNPFIHMQDQRYLYYKLGLFAYAKGKDSWEYGVRDESDTHDKMKEFAENMVCFENLIGTLDYNWTN
jgi:hypothetical protein